MADQGLIHLSPFICPAPVEAVRDRSWGWIGNLSRGSRAVVSQRDLLPSDLSLCGFGARRPRVEF